MASRHASASDYSKHGNALNGVDTTVDDHLSRRHARSSKINSIGSSNSQERAKSNSKNGSIPSRRASNLTSNSSTIPSHRASIPKDGIDPHGAGRHLVASSKINMIVTTSSYSQDLLADITTSRSRIAKYYTQGNLKNHERQTRKIPIPTTTSRQAGKRSDSSSSTVKKNSNLSSKYYDYATWNMNEGIVSAREMMRLANQFELSLQQHEKSSRPSLESLSPSSAAVCSSSVACDNSRFDKSMIVAHHSHTPSTIESIEMPSPVVSMHCPSLHRAHTERKNKKGQHRSTIITIPQDQPTFVSPDELLQFEVPLIALANLSGGDLNKLFHGLFSFLHRRSDFYCIRADDLVVDEDCDENDGSRKGFLEGQAENMLLASFRQFPMINGKNNQDNGAADAETLGSIPLCGLVAMSPPEGGNEDDFIFQLDM